jgi:hypothetical protein
VNSNRTDQELARCFVLLAFLAATGLGVAGLIVWKIAHG